MKRKRKIPTYGVFLTLPQLIQLKASLKSYDNPTANKCCAKLSKAIRHAMENKM